MEKSQKKVLLLSLSGIGNFLMQSPVFAALKAAHPDWRLTVWVAPRGTRELAENNPYIDDVIEAPIQQSLFEHIRLLQKLRKEHVDIGIVLYPGQLVKSAAYLFLAGIPKRIGNDYQLGSNPKSHFLFTHIVEAVEGIHDVEQNLQLLEPLHLVYPREAESKAHAATYTLTIPPQAGTQAQEMLSKLNIPRNKILVGFHMGSAPHFVWKRWPLEYFNELGKKLIQEYNAHILLFGDAQEKALNETLQKKLGQSASIVESTLLTTAAIIKHCKLFVSNDSGLMHIAAATGTPTAGLFGPTDERRTGPRGARSIVIRTPGTQPAYDIQKNYNLGTEPHESLVKLKPETVIVRLQELLGA